MKIREGVYYCGWCNIEFDQQVKRIDGGGRKGVAVTPVQCPKCLNLISQKTKIEMRTKIERGFRV